MIAKGNKYKIEDGEVTFTKTKGEKVNYWEYKYNLQGRLTKVYKNVDPDDKEDATPIAEFTYDTEGNRIKAVKRTPEGEKTTHFVYGRNGQVLVEKNITKEKFTSFVYAVGKKYAKVKGTIGDYLDESIEVGLVYYHHNNLGSTRVMTNQDGEKVFDQDYLPFGGDLPKPNQLEVFNETNESYKFTGQKQVASIGLYYYGARYYDPAVGRFTRQDSYRGELDNPQSQHLYVYTMNNPLRYIDPTGHASENPITKSFNSFKEIGKGFWAGMQRRRKQALDSPYDFANYMSMGALEGVVSGAQKRASKMTNSSYDFANWLTFGAVETVNQAINPEEPFSAEHWLASFETAGLITGGIEAAGSSTNFLDDLTSTKASTKIANTKINKASGKIEDWLGDDVRVINNDQGDKIFLSKNGKRKVRFDINNLHPHKNPHAHVEELIDGEWEKSGPIYPKDVSNE